MRLLMTIGYYNLLFAKGAPVSELILAVDNAQIVNAKGYGSDRKFSVADDASITVELIADEAMALPEADSAMLDKYHAVATERDEARSKVRELEKKLKEVNASLDAAKTMAETTIAS